MDNLDKVKSGDLDGVRKTGGINLLRNAANNVLGNSGIKWGAEPNQYNQPKKFV